MYGLWLFKEIKTEYGNCKVELYRKGYTASAVEIGGFVGNSLNLALENLDTITAPIGKSVCSFSIYDTEQVEYDDLFTPDATAYKVVVSTKVDGGEYNTRWSGYVTPDFFAENLSFRTPISISARDNIGYLNDVDFDLDTATITVRELIQAAFNRIAEDYPMSLSFVSQKQTAEGILTIDATISTYLLREMSWGEALETVLHDLGLQMRWVDNNTIAVLDISQLGEVFGLQRFNFIDNSGYREILPAWRELSQKQDYGLIENFFRGRISEENLTFVKEEQVVIDGYNTSTMRYYSPKNWLGNGLTINYNDYFFSVGGVMSESERNRIYFTGISKDTTAYINKFIGWRQPVYKSNNAMKVSFKALNSIQVVSQYSLQGMPTLQTFGPYPPGTAQFGLKVNVLLHTATKTYIMRYKWEELNADETDAINFVLPVLQGNANEEECVIDLGNIPYDGELELRIYGWYFIEATNWTSMPLNAVSYITDVVYTYDGSATGQDAKVVVAELHNIKEDRDYSFGQVPLDCGGINAYAGGLFKANGDELVGFRRNTNSTTYPLLELVGREIIHFNKKNYNKLSGTIKNLAKEPLRFDKMFIYKGKNYLPFAYSLDVISNTMNITTMQEVEPYTTHSFVEIKSELVTGGGATISGGNNTALQYSAEVGNAKRISELNNASESEKKEAYIIIDNAAWNESKKVPLSEMEGLDEAQVEEYLTENKYAKQSWVKGITDDLETDIAKRVLIEDYDKLQEAVDLNYANLNKATTRISTLEGYFSNGVANNAAKLGGQLPAYYATAAALGATNTNLSNLSTTVGTIGGSLSTLTGRVDAAEGTIKEHTSSISKAVADIAANTKAITAIDNRVDVLEALGFVLKDGYIYTEKTIVSKGEIISGRRASGTSTDVGGGGGISSVTAQMIADALGYVPYSSANPAGYINSSALNGYATQTWVDSNFLLKSGGTISGPITWSNGKFGVDTDAKGVYMGWSDNYIHITGDGPFYNWSKLLHADNYSSYALPLTGGAMSANSKIKWGNNVQNWNDLNGGFAAVCTVRENDYYAGLSFKGWYGFQIRTYGGDTNLFQVRGASNDAWGTWKDLIHSGNIDSQTVAGFIQQSVTDLNNVVKGTIFKSSYGPSNAPETTARYYNGICFATDDNDAYRCMLALSTNGFAYSRIESGGTWREWKQIAYTDSDITGNAGSATKLQTARTIWGKSFDGTGDISGNLLNVGLVEPMSDNSYNLGSASRKFLYAYVENAIINNTTNGYFIGSRKGIGATDGGALIYAYGNTPISFYTGGERMRILGNGNVLIGTSTEVIGKLQVEGDIYATAWIRTKGAVGWYSQDYGGGIYMTDANYVRVYNGKGFQVDGNVLIGTATDSGNGAKLQVTGNLTATGEVISSRRASSSDRRLKDNITYLDTTDCLAMIRHIRPAEWDWKDNGKHSLGFIAQDVEHLMPYAVTSIKDDVLGQKLNLQYDQFIALAIGGVQEVDNEVERLKARVEYLENKIKEYEYGNYRN